MPKGQENGQQLAATGLVDRKEIIPLGFNQYIPKNINNIENVAKAFSLLLSSNRPYSYDKLN